MLPLAGTSLGGRGGPKWRHYTVSESDFTAAAGNESITLFSLAAGETIHATIVKHSASFTGGVAADFTLEVGISGDEDKYTGQGTLDVFQAPGAAVFKFDDVVGAESFGGATDILITARCATDDVADVTAGAADIYVLVGEPTLIP